MVLVYMMAVNLPPLQSEWQDTVWDCPAAPVFVLQTGRAGARAREAAPYEALPASGRTGATSPAGGLPSPTRGTACLDKSMYIPVPQAPGPVN